MGVIQLLEIIILKTFLQTQQLLLCGKIPLVIQHSYIISCLKQTFVDVNVFTIAFSKIY